MNLIILIGNLTKNPETKITEGGVRITTIQVAVPTRKGEEPNYFTCKAFNRLAEISESFLHKGSKVAIEGSVNIKTFDKKDGTKGKDIEVIISSLECLSPKKAENEKLDEIDKDFPF